MKITVKDCLELDAFKPCIVSAGRRNLQNTVRSISVMDARDVKTAVEHNGVRDQLVLTSFYAMKDDVVTQAQVVRELAACGYKVRGVESDVFADAFAKAQSDPEKASELTAIMAYAKSPDGREMVTFPKTCGYTMQVLYRMGYIWPSTTWDYIRRFVNALAGLGFFD